MAKIVRYNGNLVPFASSSLGTERTIFGQVTQANDITSQFTPQFLRGWGIVGPSDQPTLQDFNAVSYTHGQILAYLHQVGVAEYNALQEYHIGSFCNLSGVLYSSLINNNLGNSPASSPAAWGLAGSGRLIGVQKFSANGTYTPDPRTKSIRVTVLGGGGGGGGSGATAAGQQSIGCGGAGGGYSVGYITSGITATAITVGAAGAASAAGFAAGGTGGTSSFGSIILATGGTGGNAGVAISSFPNITAVSAIGGSGSGGSLVNAVGGQGGSGLNMSSINGISGYGGASAFGGGAPASSTAGFAATTPGSGGSGALSGPSIPGGRSGGAGAAGLVIVEEFA